MMRAGGCGFGSWDRVVAGRPKTKRPRKARLSDLESWWAQQDSNLRPRDYEVDA